MWLVRIVLYVERKNRELKEKALEYLQSKKNKEVSNFFVIAAKQTDEMSEALISQEKTIQEARAEYKCKIDAASLKYQTASMLSQERINSTKDAIALLKGK